jgi:hypothetical protein
MINLNRLDPEFVGQMISQTREDQGVSACEAADRVFAELTARDEAPSCAVNGSRPATQPPPRPLGNV